MRESQQMDMKSVVALFISVAGNYSVMFLQQNKALWAGLLLISYCSHTTVPRGVLHEYAKIPRHTSQNSIAAGNLE